MEESIQKRSAVVTERGAPIGMDLEFVLAPRVLEGDRVGDKDREKERRERERENDTNELLVFMYNL